MVETILCLVALAFLAWVIVLKLEVSRLKGEAAFRLTAKGGATGRARATARGMQSFKIG
jgi:hypothetical protein